MSQQSSRFSPYSQALASHREGRVSNDVFPSPQDPAPLAPPTALSPYMTAQAHDEFISAIDGYVKMCDSYVKTWQERDEIEERHPYADLSGMDDLVFSDLESYLEAESELQRVTDETIQVIGDWSEALVWRVRCEQERLVWSLFLPSGTRAPDQLSSNLGAVLSGYIPDGLRGAFVAGIKKTVETYKAYISACREEDLCSGGGLFSNPEAADYDLDPNGTAEWTLSHLVTLLNAQADLQELLDQVIETAGAGTQPLAVRVKCEYIRLQWIYIWRTQRNRQARILRNARCQ